MYSSFVQSIQFNNQTESISPVVNQYSVVQTSEYVPVNLDDSIESDCAMQDSTQEPAIPTLFDLLYDRLFLFSNI